MGALRVAGIELRSIDLVSIRKVDSYVSCWKMPVAAIFQRFRLQRRGWTLYQALEETKTSLGEKEATLNNNGFRKALSHG